MEEHPLPPLGEELAPEVEREAKISNLKRAAQLIEKAHNVYNDFADEHPTLAAHGLQAFNIVAQTVIGAASGAATGPSGIAAGSLAGFVNGVRSEVTGYAINEVAGEHIGAAVNKAIDITAKEIRERNPDLSESESLYLASVVVIGGA